MPLSQRLILLENSRVAFLRAECADRLRRALAGKTRSCAGPFTPGEEVYYKRKDEVRWRGPAKVMFQDGQEVVLKHAGSYVSAHRMCLSRVITAETAAPENPKEKPETAGAVPEDKVATQVEKPKTARAVPIFTLDDEDPYEYTPNSLSNDTPENISDGRIMANSGSCKPKVGEDVKFRVKADNSVVYRGKIVSLAGKAKGKYANWLNIKYSSPESMAGNHGNLDWVETVDTWEPQSDKEDTNDEVNMTENDDFEEAKEAELSSWIENSVYDVVPNDGQSAMSLRWVLTIKPNGRKKARLCARGFQEDQSKLIVDSPTCARETLRLCLTLCSFYGWQPSSIDVKTAFLQGKPLERPVSPLSFPLEKHRKKVYGN